MPTKIAPGIATDGTGRPVQVLSKGRVRFLTEQEMAEIPKNSWYKYSQLRLASSHDEAIGRLKGGKGDPR